MHTRNHTKINYCTKFSHSSTLESFDQWTRILHKDDVRKLDITKTQLGQNRLALSAFVNALLEIHRESLIKSKDVSSCMRVAHNNLYISLRLCYDFGLESKYTVKRLIKEIFACEGNLWAIFSVFSFCHVTSVEPSVNNDCFTLYPGVSSETFDNTVLPAFRYYIECLSTTYDKESIPGFRLDLFLNQPIDENSSITPLMAATMRKDPQLVTYLLRHGADPLHRKSVISKQTGHLRPSPVSNIICFLNSCCALTKCSSSFDIKIFLQAIACFIQMSKAVANIQIKEACIQWSQEDHLSESPKNTFFVNISLIPYICLSNFKGPSSLLHICKVAIRKQLIENSDKLLTKSIEDLPIPFVIRKYIDLN